MPSPFVMLTQTVSTMRADIIKMKDDVGKMTEEMGEMRGEIGRRIPPKDHLIAEQIHLDVRHLMGDIVDLKR